MKFRAHETFFIRKGWLYKGLKNVDKSADVFVSKVKNPMDELGIGANMVKSLRYWLQAVGLTSEPNSGPKVQTITDLGKIIWENDKYMEETGTLWLLHYQLASNQENATAWYFFFNEFYHTEFKKEDFVLNLKNYISMNSSKDEKKIVDSSLESDFDCIINTYVPRAKSNPGKVHPENNIDCPFGELGLIDILSKRNKVYKKAQPKKDDIHPLIILAIILDQANGGKEIKISSILTSKCNVGKIFNLDVVALMNYLYKLQQLGYLRVIRTAGLDIIRIITDMDFYECIIKYYDSLNADSDLYKQDVKSWNTEI